MQKGIVRELFEKMPYACLSIVGWCLFVPLSLIIPKHRLIVFIGRDDGLFLDNVKYLFVHALGQGDQQSRRIRKVFVTSNKSVYERLTMYGVDAVLHPSLASCVCLLRAAVVVVDHTRWSLALRYHLAFGAKKIQLWHGVGFKKIELELLKEYRKRMKVTNWLVFVAYRYLAGRYPLYDAVISTSPFYTTHVFENSLRARKILDYGYPRNDILKGNNLFDENNLKLLYAKLEVIKLLKELKKDGFRIVMYAPTFRDSGGDPVSDGALDLRSLNELGEKQRILFILKFHPDPGFKYVRTAYPFVITYPHDHDAYPILKLCDLLVTDYSSIYSDFLFVGKPIIFFPYDFEKYVRQDRSIQFEYEKSTPGAKCYTMQELVEEIPIALENDEYKEKRIKCAKKMFKYIDGRASERIWRYILETFFVNTYTM